MKLSFFIITKITITGPLIFLILYFYYPAAYKIYLSTFNSPIYSHLQTERDDLFGKESQETITIISSILGILLLFFVFPSIPILYLWKMAEKGKLLKKRRYKYLIVQKSPIVSWRSGRVINSLSSKDHLLKNNTLSKEVDIKSNKHRSNQSTQNGLNKKDKEYPYKAELKKNILSHLLKEEKNENTMLQAKAISKGCEDIDIIYYKLRYREIVKSGEIEKFKKEILEEKHVELLNREANKKLNQTEWLRKGKVSYRLDSFIDSGGRTPYCYQTNKRKFCNHKNSNITLNTKSEPDTRDEGNKPIPHPH